jgi:hypothetical protein
VTDSHFATPDDLRFEPADDLCLRFPTADDLCFAATDGLWCFATTDDLCFAATDEVANTHNEPDAARTQSATVIQELRGITGLLAADYAFTARF